MISMIFLFLQNCIICCFSQMLIVLCLSSDRKYLNSFRFLLSKKEKKGKENKKRKELYIGVWCAKPAQAAKVRKAGMFPMHFR